MQAHTVAAMLTQTDPRLTGADAPQIVIIRTSGDKIQDRRLADIGGKALFTKEIERALVDNEIDMAVHSAKDLENHAGTWHRIGIHPAAGGCAGCVDCTRLQLPR